MSDIEFIELTPENIGQIGEILYKIRIRENLRQSHVAEQMNKGQSLLSGWEQNHKRPTLAMLLSYLGTCGWKMAIYKDQDPKKRRPSRL